MKIEKILFLTFALIINNYSVNAQSLKDSKTTLKVGSWSVLRSIDTMTDKVSCTGIYKSNFGIQLSSNAMYVKIPGGIEGITLRFGENSPQQMRIPEKMEKSVNAVIIEGTDFLQAVATTRLRLQILTLVRGVATEDLDISGIKSALENIRAECPVPPPELVAVVITPPENKIIDTPSEEAKTLYENEKLCPDKLSARLREAGVTEKQIKSACRNN